MPRNVTYALAAVAVLGVAVAIAVRPSAAVAPSVLPVSPPVSAVPATTPPPTGLKLPIAIESFPPFEFAQDGKVVGFDTEIIEGVFQRLGYTPAIQVLPWSRAQEFAKNGTIAGLYGLTKSAEREQFYYFTEPLSTVEDVFFKRKEDQISWTTLNDLTAYRIGISGGYAYAPVLMNAITAGSLTTEVVTGDAADYRQLVKLRTKRIDLCVCEVSVGQHLIQTNAPEFAGIDFIDKSIGDIRPYYLGISKKWPGAKELVEKFNAELATFIAEGRRKAIFTKYGVVSPLEK